VTALDSISRDAVQAVFTQTGTAPAALSRSVQLMGGSGSIMVVGGSESLVTELVELAFECERRWSRFLPYSDLSRINWAEGRPVEVSPLTVSLIEAMVEGSELTGGQFDPTLLPDLLALGYRESVVNSRRVTSLPASAQSPGDLLGVHIEGTTVTAPKGTTLDAGGIGKGFAADLVCERGMAAGAWGVMAEIGGDIVVAGRAPEGVAWSLAIEDSFDTDARRDYVRIAAGAIVTSSQRIRRFDTPGGPRHHLIDPSTHDSASTKVQTVTVIASTGARAETLTKPGFLRDTIAYLQWLPTVGAAGLVINDDGVALASGNWETYR